MYARGMTVREIQGFLAEQYGTEVSPEFISSVTDAVMSEVTTWQLMGGRLHAKRLASDLNLISMSVSLPVRPGISGPGHQRASRSGRFKVVQFRRGRAVNP